MQGTAVCALYPSCVSGPSVQVYNDLPTMEGILRSLGYDENVVANFQREGVSVEAIAALNMEQLDQLGINGIGRQAVLRAKCRAYANRPSTSSGSSSASRHQATRQVRKLFHPYRGHRKKRSTSLCLTLLCLSSRSTKRVPSILTQRFLSECDLGEKKLMIPSDASPSEVMDAIHDLYPKLKAIGGFEYLKADGSSKRFHTLQLPDGGFSASNLKFIARQSRIYLRPIQSDIDLTVSKTSPDREDEILLKCKVCNEMIAQTKLRAHIRSCQLKESEQTSVDAAADDDILEVDSWEDIGSDERDNQRAPTSQFRRATPVQTLPQDSSSSPSVQAAGSAATADRGYTAAGDAILQGVDPLDDAAVAHRKDDRGAGTSQFIPTSSANQQLSHDTNLSSTFQPASSLAFGDRYLEDYVDLIEDSTTGDESSDDELNAVLEESLKTTDDPSEVVMDARMQDKLRDMQKNARSEESIHLIIRRKKVLKSAADAIKHQKGFSFAKHPVVSFSGEEAVDLGGPKREFFTLATQQLPQLGIFEGKWEKMYFTHDITLLEKGTYKFAGQTIGWSILQGGPGFPRLHPGLYNLMCDTVTKKEDQFQIEDVTDVDVLLHLRKIENCSNESMVKDAVAQVADWAASNGFSNIYGLNIENKAEAVSALLKQHLFYRCKSEIEQFISGVESVSGLWSLILADPSAFRPLLVASKQTLDFNKVKRLFKVNFSQRGDIVEEEEETIFCWEQFLRKCEAGEIEMDIEGETSTKCKIGLHHILRFCTGADTIPPTGFEKQIDVNFFHPFLELEHTPLSLPAG